MKPVGEVEVLLAAVAREATGAQRVGSEVGPNVGWQVMQVPVGPAQVAQEGSQAASDLRQPRFESAKRNSTNLDNLLKQIESDQSRRRHTEYRLSLSTIRHCMHRSQRRKKKRTFR